MEPDSRQYNVCSLNIKSATLMDPRLFDPEKLHKPSCSEENIA